MKPCPYCGKENADEAPACGECGTEFTSAAGDSEARKQRADFGRILRILSALNLRSTAFFWAGLHLFVSMVLGAFCFYIAFGEALSDAYHPDPPILKVGEGALVVLQAPVILAHWLLAKAGLIQPSWRPFTAILFATSWSALLGVALWLVGRKIENR